LGESSHERIEAIRARRTEVMADEFRSAAVRNERVVGLVGMIAGLAGVGIGAWIAVEQDRTLGWAVAGIAGAFALQHALMWKLSQRLERWLYPLRVLNVTAAVSAPALVTLVDIYLVGSEYALTSTAPLLTFLAVAAAGMRMSRWLSAYAGALAAAQYAALYAVARPGLPPDALDKPALSVAFAVMHVLFLLLAGVFAAFSARIGRRTTRRVVTQVLERERVRSVFGEYLSPQAVDNVLAGGVQTGGERRRVAVVFADIRGFTHTASALEPEAVVDWLNSWFGVACDLIAARGGMVNKMIGDGLLALFGAPEPHASPAQAAARAALELAAAARAVRRPDGEPTRIGVGVHIGEVMLGSVGSPRRRDYTVIGDTVNVASRIEGLTRELGADVLVSAAVLEAAPELETAEVGPVQVKGRDEPVLVHRLLTAPSPSLPGDYS